MTEPVGLYRRVLDHFSELVDSIRADQWTAMTPCEGWTVRDLIEHVVVRDERLAATVGGPPIQPIAPDADLTARWHERTRWWADVLADPLPRNSVAPSDPGDSGGVTRISAHAPDSLTKEFVLIHAAESAGLQVVRIAARDETDDEQDDAEQTLTFLPLCWGAVDAAVAAG